MTKQTILRRSLIAILGTAIVGAATPSIAFNFGDMMNPTKWMGGNRNRDYGYDDGPRGGPGYGYGGPGYGGYSGPGYGGYGGGPGYGGYGGPDAGYGTPGGYGGPGYGYDSGYPGAYGYDMPMSRGAPPAAPTPPAGSNMPIYGAPSTGTSDEQAELEQLRRRVRELEGSGVR